jgi:four helix bundle protein
MSYELEELSLELIDALVPLMPRIKQRDKALEDQLRRAASSIGLNVSEAAMSDPGNKRARFHTAAGSARETQHALRQAIAWRHVRAGEAERALRLVTRLVSILWRMTRG